MVNHRILSIQDRIATKMASAGNRSGGRTGSGHSRNIEGLVDSSCKQVIKEIVKEINDNMGILYAQLLGLNKDKTIEKSYGEPVYRCDEFGTKGGEH